MRMFQAGGCQSAPTRNPSTLPRCPRALWLGAAACLAASGYSAGVTEESMYRMGAACAQNVTDCFDGKLDPANVVNREVLG